MKKTSIKILSILLVACSFLWLCACDKAEPSEPIPPELIFTLNPDGVSYTVTDCYESATGKIVIPSKYADKPVTKIEENAFSRCVNITEIVIADSVKSIGKDAFSGCEKLSFIEIPDSVIDFDYYFLGGTNFNYIIFRGEQYTNMEEFDKNFYDKYGIKPIFRETLEDLE